MNIELNNETLTGTLTVSGTLTGEIAIGGGSEPVLQNKIISSIGLGVQRYTADAGYDGLSMLTVTSAFREMHYPQNIQVNNGQIWLFAPPVFDPTGYDKIIFKNTSGSAELRVYEVQTTHEINTGNETEIAAYAFFGMTGIEVVRCPVAVSVGTSAFQGSDLGALYLDDKSGSNTIASNAFKNCASLTDIYIKSSTMATLEANIAFQGTSNVRVHVPSALIATYQADSRWTQAVSSYGISFVGI